MSNKDRPYEVGYKKPPKHSQFKKGQPSANPKGRKKKSRNFAVLFRENLAETVVITENGKEKKITVQEAIVKRLFVDAMKGRSNAVERILNTYTRHFQAVDALPGQAAKAQQAYLDSLSIEELEELIEKLNAATEENKTRNKLQPRQTQRRDPVSKWSAVMPPKKGE